MGANYRSGRVFPYRTQVVEIYTEQFPQILETGLKLTWDISLKMSQSKTFHQKVGNRIQVKEILPKFIENKKNIKT